MTLRKKGLLFVVSAPSGAGKTSLLKSILDENTDLTVAVSHTSRLPREGETHGSSYYFTSRSEFTDLISKDSFLEYALVHENYYGTSKEEVQKKLAEGKHVILEIDVQGAEQIKRKFPEAVLIFIFPPSLEILKERLENRQTDSPEVIELRIKNAREELERSIDFDYLVINDNFETAKYDLQCIFRAEELAVSRNQDILDDVLSIK
ncbi:MAG: guanylate kinase [Neisseriaceae bacterium]|nr:guanylate kinase [Neisseriaceae bacterium PsAf]MCV2503009.1 guanylate kinase [Neisseriaceae bacterium]MCV2509341.1 guanylate kinase [Neisseriaceae bacterium]